MYMLLDMYKIKAVDALTCAMCVPCSNDQAPVVQRLDNVIHRINHYPVDKR